MNSEEVLHPGSGPHGEKLFTRYHYTEPRSQCLVHLSGVHGVEGHLGSLVQKEILKKDFSNLNFQIVIVETVNPFGLAWNRRCNQANVDLNRNTLENYEIPNPHIEKFAEFLNSGTIMSFAKTLPTIARIGISGTVQAVACGQTQFPQSLFFAGHELQPELKSLEENLRRIVAPEAEVYALDVHSGLGRHGQETLMLTGFEGSKEKAVLEKALQAQLLEPGKSSKSYRADGSLGLLLRKLWGAEKVFYVCQEFGTRPVYQVLRSLIAENRFFQNRSKLSQVEFEQELNRVQSMMLDAFFPHESKWRQSCVELGLLRFEQLVDNLS